jgi:membrane protease YdiL (CAAX protease family)
MREHLGRSDYRFIAICLALFAATATYSVKNFFRAFPEASIDFRVSRNDAKVLAAQFLAGQGHRLDGYREASRFDFSDEAKTFLEREAGIEQANRLMGSRVRLWRWSYRWFRPRQKEEFSADITPAGEVVGFDHQLAEDAARPAVTAEQARTLAENFLRTHMRRDPAALDFVESSEVARPHRTDRVFTWKERDFNLHDATIRVEVTVQGNEAGGYSEYLKIPEQWTRDYKRLRSKNNAAQTVDSAVMVLLVVGLVVTIVMRVRQQDVQWRRAAIVGTIGMALSFLSSLNQFPLSEFNYPTTDAYSSFVLRQLLQAVLSALGAGGLLFVLTAGAEPLYREAFPGKISLGNLFSLRGLRTKRFLLGAVLGIALTGIFVAYQTAFYIIAYRFGAWSPADVPYDNLLNTKFPWLYVLFGGFLPAVSEEFMFRMFGVTFLRKLTRSLPVAIVAAGFIWGFGHAGYPQQPFWIRGVEVGIGGIALGLVMMRWGILPTLVWHYSVDAMYSAMLLLRSQNLYFRLSGAASAGVIVLPVLLALVAYWRHGGFEPETGLLNGDEPGPVEPSVAAGAGAGEVADGYQALRTRTRVAAVAILAAGLLCLLLPVSRFGASPTYKLTQGQARGAADAFVRAQGMDPTAFRQITFPASRWGSDDTAAKYFLERLPVRQASAMFERYRPLQVWMTRYFKSLDKEEWTVAVHPETGKAIGFGHDLPEDRPGADIADDAARQTAAAFAAAQGWDVSAMELKENRSEKKKARRDRTLIWEARAGDPRNVGETNFRVDVGVAGDMVNSLRVYWKVPEAFERSRSEQNLFSIAGLGLRIAVMAGLIVCGLWVLIQNIRRGQVQWKTVLRIAVPAALLTVLGPLLSWRLMLQGYQTAIPIETYLAMMYTVLGMSVLFAFLLLGGTVALVTSNFPGSERVLTAANRARQGLDAGVALLAAIGFGLLTSRLEAVLADRFHTLALFSIGSPDLIVSAAPAVAATASAVRSTIVYGAVLGIIALMARRAPRVAIALLLAFAMVSTDVRTVGEFALEYGGALASVAAAAAFCLWFARGNYLAYMLTLWALAMRGPLAEFFGNGLTVQGWVLVGLASAAVLWAVAPGLARRRSTNEY